MFAQPMNGLPMGIAPLPGSRGSALTPLDGLRPMLTPGHVDGPWLPPGLMPAFSAGGIAQPAPIRVRAPSASSRHPPPAASGCLTPSILASYPPSNLSEADNIKVAVRVRPLFPHETERGGTAVVQVANNATIKIVVPGPAGTSMQRDFAFHACLGPEVGQADVLHLCGVPQLLDAALAGYNVTIFAYGQTGSGKTYTMSGREDVIGSDSYSGDATHDGIITRAITHLFSAMEAKKADVKYGIAASYLEIYNEGIFDLLNLKAKNLPVKWDAAVGFFVPGLKQVPCSKVDSMMEVIRTGMKHRHVGSHELNIESSRSHSIMTISVTATPTDPSAADFGTPRMGKISFVDLAGSERLKDSKSEGAMLKETTNINKSLFVLGKVVSALSERDMAGTSAHIPYRDSKLTKLLMDSLGGNALALMIACCSPASTAVEETLSTLSYATRAKNIQNRPTIQYDPKEAQITNLRREIELLRQENAYLRDQMRLGGGAAGAELGTPLYNSRPAWPGLGATPPSSDAPRGGGALDTIPSVVLGAGGGGGGIGGAPSRDGSRDNSMSTLQGPAGRLLTPHMVGAVSPPDHGFRSSPSSAHLEPLQLRASVEASAAAVAAGGAGGSAGSLSGGNRSRRLSTAGPVDDDLMRRLMDTQTLLSRFSEENSRLAKENDRLRAGRQMLSMEHGEVLDEIETLRAKLGQLENAVLSGSQTPNAARAALHSAMGSTAASVSSGGAPTANGLTANGSPPNGGYTSSRVTSTPHTPSDIMPGGPLPPGPSYPVAAAHVPGSANGLPHSRGGLYGSHPQLTLPYPPPGPLGAAAPYHSHMAPPGSAGSGIVMAAAAGGPVHTPLMQAGMAAAAVPGSPAVQPPRPHPHPPGGSAPAVASAGGVGGVANVMAIGGGAAGNTNAMRTRTKPGGGGGGGGGGSDDSIIVADRAKLALLLGDGPIEPSVALRPVPIKPTEPAYANPAKAAHLQHIQKQIQRSGSNPPSSPSGTQIQTGT